MKSSNTSAIAFSNEAVETAKSLRTLYFTRAAFSIVWILLVTTLAGTNAVVAMVLFIIYPAWDVIATFFDIKSNPPSANKTPQYVNIAIGVITTIAVYIALQKGIAEALVVFSAWAILTGLIQLILGLHRRKQLDGQWPMIISGGQSMLAGVSIFLKAHTPGTGVNTLAGYAAFGAFYFLLAAYRLSKTIKHATVTV
ncbi:hypothetical protein MUK70_00405 [Dyadobacter chenwenxiniae]|uniref:DUF308 domain-containing protein n=1 Tax=Dyadobacter chenwenxiniae TaxID=2906456 RepID=A0A9X1PLW7_9BACT|nr:hypothetical protein [Dyadobacter chenwenxiniae]MCF0063787.1 hypothetical protein [Dyadobacter chenwenxiniae]UON83463.1 hypothetical protein MUK70_00405 [Dyadobacter chenwenxiniae]